MAVREFTDRDGRAWLAWDIKPEAIHPVTKAEDYLADCFVTGWIVFETASGDEKRRLCPWPMNWMNQSDEGLRQLLDKAEVIPALKVAAQRRSAPTELPELLKALEETPDLTDLNVVRTFRYPGGRFWTVCVINMPEDGGPPVLRFTAGFRMIDLRRWPKDWADRPDDKLVELLRLASPRRVSGPVGDGTPKRRWDDQPQAMA